MKNKFYYSKLGPKDLKALSNLFYVSRKLSFSEKYLKRKYNNFYLKTFKQYSYGCFENGQLISHCGLIPMEYIFKKKKYYLGQICDSITHQDHKRKGHYSKVVKHIEQKSQELGLDGLIVFSNEKSSKIMNTKKNWAFLNTFRYYEIKIKTFPLLKIVHKMKLNFFYMFLTGIICRLSNPKNTQCNSNSSNSIYCNYSQKFINYKTYNRNFRIKLLNSHIWFKFEDGIIIGDIESVNEKNLQPILNKLRIFCVFMGISKIKFISYPGTELDNSLGKIIKFSKERIDVYINLFTEIQVSKIKLNFSESNTF